MMENVLLKVFIRDSWRLGTERYDAPSGLSAWLLPTGIGLRPMLLDYAPSGLAMG